MSNIPFYDFKASISERRLLGLWRMLSGLRLKYFSAIGSLAIASAAKTSSYLLLAYLVDTVLVPAAQFLLPADAAFNAQVAANNGLEVLILIALGFVGLALIEGLFTFTSGKLAAQTSEGVVARLRDYIYNHLQRMTFTYHDNMQTGELLQRSTSDVDAIRRFFAEQGIGVGRILSLFVVNFSAIMFIDVKLALLSVLVVPFNVIVSFFFFRWVSQAYEVFQEQDAILSTTLQENLSGVRVVKAFARQPYEMEKFDRENWKRYELGTKLTKMHALFWPIMDTMGFAQLLGGLTLGAFMVIDNTISLGAYLAYVGVVGRIIWPLRELGRIVVQMSTGLVSYGRVQDIIKVDREDLDSGLSPEIPLSGEVVFNKVSTAYHPDEIVLHDIDFRCEAGQSIALLGSTGSGKTSLVNLIPRFYDYTAGSILLDGKEVTEYSRDYLRRQIGIVEQEPFLFSRSIRDNIAYGVGRVVTDEEVHAAARAAAVHDVIQSFPKGYDTLVGERGVTLSGGQKQRVALARTLLKNPRILILDDSTSSVDTETEAAIRDALNTLMENRTTFIIAHRIQSLMHADLILVLDKGRIVQRGTHDELMAIEGTYRKVYDVQARIEQELEKESGSV